MIGVAVIATREFYDQIAARVGAGQADRAHGGFGAGGDEAHLLQPRVKGDHPLREFDFTLARRSIGRSVADRVAHRIQHRRMRVAQDQRSPGSDEVEILATVDVVEELAGGPGNEQRGTPHCAKRAHGRVDAPGNDPDGAVE